MQSVQRRTSVQEVEGLTPGLASLRSNLLASYSYLSVSHHKAVYNMLLA